MHKGSLRPGEGGEGASLPTVGFCVPAPVGLLLPDFLPPVEQQCVHRLGRQPSSELPVLGHLA